MAGLEFVTPAPTAGFEERRATAKAAGFSDEKIRAYEAQVESRSLEARNRGELGSPKDIARQTELADPEASGAPFKVRAVDSLMRGLWAPEQRLNYMKKTFGEANVRVSEGGDIYWKDEQGEHPISGKNFEPSDLGAVVGYLPELIGMGGASLFTRLAKVATRIKATAGGAAAGDLVRQLAGSEASGEQISEGKSFESLTGAAVAGAFGQGVGELGGLPTVNPAKLVAGAVNRAVQKSEHSGFAEEMVGMQERQGVPLSFYQETGTPVAKMLEGFAGRTAFGRLAGERLPPQQNVAVRARAERFIQMLGRNPEALGDEQVGAALAETGRKAVDDVLTGMQKTGREYFNFRSQIPGLKDKLVTPSVWRQTLLERVEEFRHYGDARSLRAAAELEKMANDPAFQFGMSPTTVQSKLTEYNSRSYGKEGDKLFATLDNASSVELTKKLHEALKQDLLVEASTLRGAPSMALRQGLEKYGQEAELLTRLRNTPILQLLDKKGLLRRGAQPVGAEAIPQGLRQGMLSGKISPSEMRSAIKLLQATDPEIAHTITGSVIQDALLAGIKAGETQPWKFDRAAFAAALPPSKYLEALYGDVWNPGVRTTGLRISTDLNELSMLVRRSGEKIGIGIPEAPTSTLGAMIRTAITNPSAAIAQFGYKIIAPYEISAVMTNPAARKATLEWLGNAAKGPVTKPAKVRAAIGQGVAPVIEAGLRPGVETEEEF